MDFMEMMKKSQKQYTENGAVGFSTEGHSIVDLNFAIPSFRNSIDFNKFDYALAEDEKLTLKWLLYLRDIRFGVGERKSFRSFVKHLAQTNKELAKKFLSVVPIEEYGRWDDYIDLLDIEDSEIFSIVKEKIREQFIDDICNCVEDKPVSLLAKWMPSENASSIKTKKKAKIVRNFLHVSPRDYRRALSILRNYIGVVEKDMSSNNWDKIKYENVPSKANLIYSNAFSRHDYERREQYLNSLKDGKTSINAQALFLHDIVHKYMSCWDVKEYDETLEQMWKAQDKVEGFSNTIVVRDGSGSMTTTIGNSSVTALDVANAITLYCAENSEGMFKNKFITFSRIAKVVDISHKNSLHDKLKFMSDYDSCSNTDIENVFNLILDTAIRNHVKQDDMPKTVLIISD